MRTYEVAPVDQGFDVWVRADPPELRRKDDWGATYEINLKLANLSEPTAHAAVRCAMENEAVPLFDLYDLLVSRFAQPCDASIEGYEV